MKGSASKKPGTANGGNSKQGNNARAQKVKAIGGESTGNPAEVVF